MTSKFVAGLAAASVIALLVTPVASGCSVDDGAASRSSGADTGVSPGSSGGGPAQVSDATDPDVSDGAPPDGSATDGGSCPEFQVGTVIDPKIGGTPQARVSARAIAHYALLAAAALDEITSRCRAIAIDLGVSAASREAAEANLDPGARAGAFCGLAVQAIGAARSAGGTLYTDVHAPARCEAVVRTKTQCQLECTGQTACDLAASPPRCTGGVLSVACDSTCTGPGNSVRCEGSCAGSCLGACTTAPAAPVLCQGRCDGICTSSGATGGTGIQNDGSCNGNCQGTCERVPFSTPCSGSCAGVCSGSCSGIAGAPAVCDGQCAGTAEALTCWGGSLEGGCVSDPSCEQSCKVLAILGSACVTPKLGFRTVGFPSVNVAARLARTLDDHAATLLELQSRTHAMLEVAGTVTGSAVAIATLKPSCIPLVAVRGSVGVADATHAAEVLGHVMAAIGL